MERVATDTTLYAPFYMKTMKITSCSIFSLFLITILFYDKSEKYQLKLKLRNVHKSIRAEFLDKEIEFVLAQARNKIFKFLTAILVAYVTTISHYNYSIIYLISA